MFINRRMDKNSSAFSHNRIVFSNKKEQTINTLNIDKPQNYVKWKKSD